MKALVFAAGLGNRLKPITDTAPKALVPVGGKPMLEHIILKLKDAGFTDITINIHHLGQQIIDFLQERITSELISIFPMNANTCWIQVEASNMLPLFLTEMNRSSFTT